MISSTFTSGVFTFMYIYTSHSCDASFPSFRVRLAFWVSQRTELGLASRSRTASGYT